MIELCGRLYYCLILFLVVVMLVYYVRRFYGF